MNREIKVVCKNCKTEYVVGRNACITSGAELLGFLQQKGTPMFGMGGLAADPDLIGDCDWTNVDAAFVDQQKTNVEAALSRKITQWKCYKCNATQDYPKSL